MLIHGYCLPMLTDEMLWSFGIVSSNEGEITHSSALYNSLAGFVDCMLAYRCNRRARQNESRMIRITPHSLIKSTSSSSPCPLDCGWWLLCHESKPMNLTFATRIFIFGLSSVSKYLRTRVSKDQDRLWELAHENGDMMGNRRHVTFWTSHYATGLLPLHSHQAGTNKYWYRPLEVSMNPGHTHVHSCWKTKGALVCVSILASAVIHKPQKSFPLCDKSFSPDPSQLYLSMERTDNILQPLLRFDKSCFCANGKSLTLV